MTAATAPTPLDPRSLRWDMEEEGLTLLPIRWNHALRWKELPQGGGEHIAIWAEKEKRWHRVKKANWLPFIQGLAEGHPVPEVYRRAKPHFTDRVDAAVRFILGRILGSLRRWEIMDFVLPEMPQTIGRYRIHKELGRGGVGIVWLATDESTGAGPFALKHAWNGAGPLASRDQALRDEYANMNAFDHPGIVKGLDAFEHDGRFHLVRPCLDGTPLTRMDPARRNDPAVRASLTRQVADTVDHMIGRGYFYLDLKPSNYFVDAKGHVTLSDLGMCRPFKPDTRSLRGSMATYAYAAPELYKRNEVTEPTLVYALGALHWQLVVGRAPKPKAPYAKLLERIPAGVPEWERELIAAALKPEKADRPQTIREAAALVRS